MPWVAMVTLWLIAITRTTAHHGYNGIYKLTDPEHLENDLPLYTPKYSPAGQAREATLCDTIPVEIILWHTDASIN